MTIEAIKDAIAGLPQDSQVALAAWLNLQTMDGWDRKCRAILLTAAAAITSLKELRPKSAPDNSNRSPREKRTEMNEAFGVVRVARFLGTLS
jgi:hypothetical protein